MGNQADRQVWLIGAAIIGALALLVSVLIALVMGGAEGFPVIALVAAAPLGGMLGVAMLERGCADGSMVVMLRALPRVGRMEMWRGAWFASASIMLPLLSVLALAGGLVAELERPERIPLLMICVPFAWAVGWWLRVKFGTHAPGCRSEVEQGAIGFIVRWVALMLYAAGWIGGSILLSEAAPGSNADFALIFGVLLVLGGFTWLWRGRRAG